MIRIKAREKTYKKGTNWKIASIDESNVLIASVDLECDENVPVEERNAGEWFFTDDFTVMLYDVESTSEESEHDFAVTEVLREMRIIDPDELRYWFSDLLVGNHILVTRWSEPDSDGDQYLEFVETYLDN